MAAGGYKKKLARSVAFILFGRAWGGLLTFFTTPYIVHKMGADNYGLMTMVFIITGYFTLLDLGMGISVIKHLAERAADGDAPDRDSRMIFTALTTNMAAGAIGAGALFLFTPAVVSMLKLSAEARPLAYNVFHICALVFFINMFAAVFSSIPQALQRFDIFTWLRLSVQTIQTVGTIALLANGHKLISVMWLYVATTALNSALFIFMSKRLLPGAFKKILLFDLESFRRLFPYGFYSTVTKISSLLVSQVDRLLVGTLMPISWVAYYATASQASGYVLQIATSSGSVIMPAASELNSSGDTARLRSLLVNGSRYALISCLPLTVLLTALPRESFQAWMGEGFAQRGAAALALLTIGNFLQGIAFVPSMALMGMGKARLISAISLFSGGVIIGLCFLLIPHYGIAGAAFAYAASMAVMPVPFYISSCAGAKCGAFELINAGIGRPLLAGAVNFCVLLAAKPLVTGRLSLIVVAIGGGLVYCAALVVFKAVNRGDLDMLKGFARKG